MKYKYILAGLYISAFSNFSNGQDTSSYNNLLSNNSYLHNPIRFTKSIQPRSSEILIERGLPQEVVFQVNGTSKVNSITYDQFKDIYKSLRISHNDTNSIRPLNELENHSKCKNAEVGEYDINIVHLNFNSISKEAINNGDYELVENEIIEKTKNETNQLTHQASFFSFLTNQLYGDRIKFNLLENSIIHDENVEIEKIEIDFGNNLGFQTITLGNSITVNYENVNGYIEAILKLHVKESGVSEIYYAHHTLFHKSSANLRKYNLHRNALKNSDISSLPIYTYHYPSNEDELNHLCNHLNIDYYNLCSNYSNQNLMNKINYSIIYNPENDEFHLKKPFVVVDGFDPGDKRNAFLNDINSDALKYDRDYRGIIELLDGVNSPWDEGISNTNFVDSLISRGFDIVIVNFKEGAGPIKKNAGLLSGLIDGVLNGEMYRINKTQEMTVVGPSMGGLITRIAIRCLELNRKEHYIKQWISFDSPHKGATIPIGLQHAVNYGSGMIDDSFKDGLDKLNSTAAKEMLLHHHENTGSQANPSNKFIQLQEFLNEIGFPEKCERMSISNGGEQRLYPNYSKIIDFGSAWGHTLEAWDNYNSDGTANVFTGNTVTSSRERFQLVNHMAVEKAVGGWVAANYSINYVDANEKSFSDPKNNFPKTRSCFIPSCSAFGIEPSRESIFYPVSKYAAIDNQNPSKITTPFDAILGMSKNEEHVKITPYTRDHVLNEWVSPLSKNTTRPLYRLDQYTTQIIKKPVAYVVEDTISFALKNNEFRAIRGSDIRVVAGKNISFLPGTYFYYSSLVHAYIDTSTTISTALKLSGGRHENNRSYFDENPYKNRIHDYSEIEKELEPAEVSSISVAIYPNPGSSEMNILLDKVANKNAEVRVYNMTGMLMYSASTTRSQLKIDVNSWANGVYLVEVKSDGNTQTVKYTKI